MPTYRCLNCGKEFRSGSRGKGRGPKKHCSRRCWLGCVGLGVGSRHGRLETVRFSQYDADRNRLSVFRCDCGTEKEILERHVKSGLIRSCGCLHEETIRNIARTHDASYTVEYKAFMNARTRCTNPKHNSYPNYGGRGIEFKFESFEEWYAVLGPRPSAGYSVDRFPDPDGPYSPTNVRWATRSEQNKNKQPRQRKPP